VFKYMFSSGCLGRGVSRRQARAAGGGAGDERANELGLGRRAQGGGGLIHCKPRVTVDADPTVSGRQGALGPLLAQAGSRFPGPGPGCGLVRGEAPRAGVWPCWAGLRWAVLGPILAYWVG
jgi:hypothetical protein